MILIRVIEWRNQLDKNCKDEKSSESKASETKLWYFTLFSLTVLIFRITAIL